MLYTDHNIWQITWLYYQLRKAMQIVKVVNNICGNLNVKTDLLSVVPKCIDFLFLISH